MLVIIIIIVIIVIIIWSIINLSKQKFILNWRLTYGYILGITYQVKIEITPTEKPLDDDLLIIGYILFLANYFDHCDQRQIKVMHDYLLNYLHLGNSKTIHDITFEIYDIIFQTLNDEEKNLITNLFKFNLYYPYKPFFSPITYTLDKESNITEKDYNPLFAKYRFVVSKDLISALLMSPGPEIILLPLTCGTLYEFVVEEFNNNENKEKLDKMIIELLTSHKDVDCRSLEGFVNLPIQIIKKYNLKS